MSSSVIRLKPNDYIHVLDVNKNVTRVIVGPTTYTRREHEQVVEGPKRLIMIKQTCFVKIENPIITENGNPVFDEYGNAKLRWGDQEIRFARDPFPLYPGEVLVGDVTELSVIPISTAFKIRAVRDIFNDKGEIVRNAGDEWLVKEQGTYYPRIEEEKIGEIKATVVKENQALRIRALQDFVQNGKQRYAGEVWLYRETGAYLPEINEEILGVVNAITITETRALQLRATTTFDDFYDQKRKAGEEWLITFDVADSHIPDVYEEIVNQNVNIISLNNRQYCIIVNPVDESGKPSWGERKLVKGEATFFLKPGERLENNIQNIIVLGEDETLLLKAKESFVEGNEKRKAGDVWLIKGPCDYLPPVEVEVLKQRKIIPLDEGEGIYIRDLETGKVRAEIGKSYMLKANEELWEKELSDVVEELLANSGNDKKQVSTTRDKTRVVSYRAPFGTAVQVYDYKHKKSRIIFGPDLVTLQPDEEFTVLSLSGGVPKKENEVTTLALDLGPGNMSDRVEVETSDHARLRLLLSYKWKFDFDKKNDVESSKIFSIGDYIGIACRSMASRIRAAVASCPFERFHKSSSDIIKAGVFGVDKETNIIREVAFFKSNNLLISGVDVQAVEPIDQRTVDALQKSVQLAIEITTQSKEETHRHNARKKDQIAQGKLERQKLQDEIEAEKKRTELVRLKCSTEIVKRIGELTSEAYAKFESSKIEGKTLVEQATHQSKAHIIQEESSIEEERLKQEQIRNHLKKLNELDIQKARELSNIECKKFEQIVEAIGCDTIESMAKAGPEMQTKLLQGLGLQGFLITDGNNPINLFNTANNLVGNTTGPKIEENVKDEDF